VLHHALEPPPAGAGEQASWDVDASRVTSTHLSPLKLSSIRIWSPKLAEAETQLQDPTSVTGGAAKILRLKLLVEGWSARWAVIKVPNSTRQSRKAAGMEIAVMVPCFDALRYPPKGQTAALQRLAARLVQNTL